MPRSSRGRYDVTECVRWYIARLEAGGARDPDDIEEVVRERTRLYRAQARFRELETARVERSLVTVDEATAALEELAAILMMGLQALPVRVATALVGAQDEAEIIAIATKETHETLDSIRERTPALAADLRAGEYAVDATTDEERGAVGG